MITVIIPYMEIWPYDEKIGKTLKSLESQTVNPEIIISEQPVSQHIRLNYLINKGVREAQNENIFLCNADIELPDPTLFERMLETDYDVIFCAYYSNVLNGYKPADGAGVFTSKRIISDFGYFNEQLLGVSRSTFKFVDWSLKNANWHCSKEFQIRLIPSRKLTIKEKQFFNDMPDRPIKVHKETLEKCKPYFDSSVNEFKRLGLWGFN